MCMYHEVEYPKEQNTALESFDHGHQLDEEEQQKQATQYEQSEIIYPHTVSEVRVADDTCVQVATTDL